MVRPFRISIIALSAVLMLSAMQIDVSAQKKSSKRKSRAKKSVPVIVMAPVQRRVPVIVMPPVLSPAVADDTFFMKASPTQAPKEGKPATASAPAPGNGANAGSPGGDQDGKGRKQWLTRPLTPTAGSLVISEFRVRGPNGANDEFIEIYNDFGADHTVADSGAGTGYAVAASDGTARCVIPNGTVIPNRGHYLCVNSIGYSLASYPAGNGTTATADATYTTDIPDNAGIAIFNTSVAANFTLANRFDAVGSTGEANTLYKEGTGYPNLTPSAIDYSFYRDMCGKGGSITVMGVCPISTPKDTDNNATDFIFVDTSGFSAGAGQRLGAPGPENLSSPIQRNAVILRICSTPPSPRTIRRTACATLPATRRITRRSARSRFVEDLLTIPVATSRDCASA